MDVIAGNKKIAEFMGNSLNNGLYNNQFHNFPVQHSIGEDELLYHSSWDWLMSVVEKIEGIGYFCMINRWTSVYTGNEKEGQRISISTVEGKSKIMNTFKAVILFIEWYEKDKIARMMADEYKHGNRAFE